MIARIVGADIIDRTVTLQFAEMPPVVLGTIAEFRTPAVLPGVRVPDERNGECNLATVHGALAQAWNAGFNQCRDEVLRMNANEPKEEQRAEREG